jgi:hypothetical protein
MQELVRRRSPRGARPSEAPAPAAAAAARGAASGEGAAGAGAVEVVWGPLIQHYQVSGMTVGETHRVLRGHLGIPGGVRALVNGAAAAPDARLRAGDVLEFVRFAGEKGA